MKNVLLSLLVSCLFIACNDSSSTSESEEVGDETTYDFDLSKTTIRWTAFKTPDKIGVPGSFDEITIQGNEFSINTKSVNTKNEIRDATLVESFFDHLSDPLISGSYSDPIDGSMAVKLKMNGVEKTIDFEMMETDSSTTFSASIDILADFSGNAALEAISLACKELHLDKTWSDVSLEIIQLK